MKTYFINRLSLIAAAFLLSHSVLASPSSSNCARDPRACLDADSVRTIERVRPLLSLLPNADPELLFACIALEPGTVPFGDACVPCEDSRVGCFKIANQTESRDDICAVFCATSLLRRSARNPTDNGSHNGNAHTEIEHSTSNFSANNESQKHTFGKAESKITSKTMDSKTNSTNCFENNLPLPWPFICDFPPWLYIFLGVLCMTIVVLLALCTMWAAQDVRSKCLVWKSRLAGFVNQEHYNIPVD